MIQPFEIIDGLSSMKYKAIFVSDSKKKLLEDRERYNVFIEIDPWNKVKECNCECKGFKFGKGKWCKHISNKDVEQPGIMQILLSWGEITNIPIEENE